MKKFLALLLVAILVLLSACGTTPIADNTDLTDSNETVASDNSSAIADNENVNPDNVVVDILVGNDGCYCLMGDIEVEYFEGEISYIVIQDPALLAFQVSSDFDNGVYLFRLSEADTLIEMLADVLVSLEQSGNTELAEKVQAVIDEFAKAGPITSAST